MFFGLNLTSLLFIMNHQLSRPCWWRMLQKLISLHVCHQNLYSRLSHRYQDFINISVAGSDHQESLLLKGLETAKFQIQRSNFWSTRIDDLKFRKIEKISRLRYFRRHVNNEYNVFNNAFIIEIVWTWEKYYLILQSRQSFSG